MSATDIFNSESEYEAMVLENTARVIKLTGVIFTPTAITAVMSIKRQMSLRRFTL